MCGNMNSLFHLDVYDEFKSETNFRECPVWESQRVQQSRRCLDVFRLGKANIIRTSIFKR